MEKVISSYFSRHSRMKPKRTHTPGSSWFPRFRNLEGIGGGLIYCFFILAMVFIYVYINRCVCVCVWLDAVGVMLLV